MIDEKGRGRDCPLGDLENHQKLSSTSFREREREREKLTTGLCSSCLTKQFKIHYCLLPKYSGFVMMTMMMRITVISLPDSVVKKVKGVPHGTVASPSLPLLLLLPLHCY